jgi:hypothetical protein
LESSRRLARKAALLVAVKLISCILQLSLVEGLEPSSRLEGEAVL